MSRRCATDWRMLSSSVFKSTGTSASTAWAVARSAPATGAVDRTTTASAGHGVWEKGAYTIGPTSSARPLSLTSPATPTISRGTGSP